jgi:hypothetical protein
MGNIWAVNRGLADHRQAVRILREFRTRWRKTGDAWPWWSLQPGYPDGTFPATRSGEWNILQGVYANGGLIPWVGGELALAALEHGWEGFGVEQIRLYHDLLRRTRGGTNTWYWRDGRPGLSAKESSDHSVWDIGAWMRALQEGVGGIQDVSKSLERVLCSPRWEAAGVREATVVSRYAGTNSYFGYRVRRVGRIAVEIDYAGSGSRARFFVLLPKGRRAHAVTVDGRNVGFATQRVEESAYCSFRAGIRKTAAANSVRILMGRKMADTVRLPATPFSLNRVRIDLE